MEIIKNFLKMKKLITTITFFVAFLSFSFVSTAQTAADSANVTFQVDMNGVSSSFTTPEVNGSFNNWYEIVEQCQTMTRYQQ